MLMVEHHIEVVTGLAERIAVMHHGALLACDTPAAIMANDDRAGRPTSGSRCEHAGDARAAARGRDLHVHLGAVARAPGRLVRGAAGRRDRAARPQRRRQDDDAARRSLGLSGRDGDDPLAGEPIARAADAPRSSGAAIGYVPEDRESSPG